MQLFLFGGAIREKYRVQMWPQNPIMAPFPEYLSAVMSADASADEPPRINIRQDLVFSVKLRLAFNPYPFGLIPYSLGLIPGSLDPRIP